MQTLKLTQMAEGTGTVIPPEMLEHLNVRNGDSLYAIEAPGGYFLRSGSVTEEQVKLGLQFMEEYSETFAALAK